jgi:release factor glutamine methyltransferase
MNVEQALAMALAQGLERLDATVLLAQHMRCRREWLIAHPSAPVDAQVQVAYASDCRRRADGVPLAYLTGRREFMGLELHVNPDVLVPRPETETLAGWAIECVRAMPMDLPRPRVIDLGTGSGALALAIAAACPRADVTATDCSASALAVAQGNARRLGLNLHFAQGDWWSAVGNGRFDLAVANPPYVAQGDSHLTSLRHEPRSALVAAQSGLAALAQVIAGAARHLSGWLLLEHGWNQTEPVQRLLSQAGFSDVETRADLNGQSRCTGARLG